MISVPTWIPETAKNIYDNSPAGQKNPAVYGDVETNGQSNQISDSSAWLEPVKHWNAVNWITKGDPYYDYNQAKRQMALDESRYQRDAEAMKKAGINPFIGETNLGWSTQGNEEPRETDDTIRDLLPMLILLFLTKGKVK